MFAEVVLSKVTKDIDKVYHYAIPEDLREKVRVGAQVLVPFGRRRDIGYVIGLVETTEFSGIKKILEVLSAEPIFEEKAVLFARWVSQYYLCYFMTALRCVLPPGKGIRKQKSERDKQETENRDQSTKISELEASRILTGSQQKAYDQIKKAIDGNKPEKFLLYGVTGSGKTEVYLQAIAHLLSLGKSAIVLVPEIGLTPQMVGRFRERFGDSVTVLHSDLTEKERRTNWKKVFTGEARIVLGTRLALFAPVKNLGLIVIDEEYETTYKSEKSPRYHVREAALYLASLHAAVVVLGSATPAIETYYKAETGEYHKLSMPERIDARPLPPVEIVDMRKELRAKNFSVLSLLLQEELGSCLEKKEQAILFMNRLGYFTFVMCRECGLTVECPKCSVSLSYYSSNRNLRCGRCGCTAPLPNVCSRCNSSSIKYFGAGTQRIADEAGKLFPSARILRYDRDAVSKRGSHAVIFSAFAEGKADVLIGTQMVAKGLDVANVTLVGVVSADTALNLPDFRSAERTFQLLTQVAGRAGRHHLPGKVIIQTYTPEHYAIQAAAKHDYEDFYRQEIEHRRELGYPPFSQLISLLVTGPEERKVEKAAEDLRMFLEKRLTEGILGPVPAAIARLSGEWRYRILLKGTNLEQLQTAVKETLEKAVIPSGARVAVDVEPVGLL